MSDFSARMEKAYWTFLAARNRRHGDERTAFREAVAPFVRDELRALIAAQDKEPKVRVRGFWDRVWAR